MDVPEEQLTAHQRWRAHSNIHTEIPVLGALVAILWLAMGLRLWANQTKPHDLNLGRSRNWNIAAAICITVTGILLTFFLALRAAVAVSGLRVDTISAGVLLRGRLVVEDPTLYPAIQKLNNIRWENAEFMVCFFFVRFSLAD